MCFHFIWELAFLKLNNSNMALEKVSVSSPISLELDLLVIWIIFFVSIYFLYIYNIPEFFYTNGLILYKIAWKHFYLPMFYGLFVLAEWFSLLFLMLGNMPLGECTEIY